MDVTTFHWIAALPEDEQRQFWRELFGALDDVVCDQANPGAAEYAQAAESVLRPWKATAMAYADGTAEILATATMGDFGEVPRSEGRLLKCGLCYEENGEEVHPHPECTWEADHATAPRGQGMEQGAARKRAKELGGIAVSARPRNSREGGWHLGGWPSDKDVWIVISPDGRGVLDDGPMGAVGHDH